MSFCPKCGAQIADTSAFCPMCGAQRQTPQQPAQPQPFMQQPQQPQDFQQPIQPQPYMQEPAYGAPDSFAIPEQPKAEPGNKKILIGVIAAVVVLAVIIISIVLLAGDKSKDDDDDIPAYEEPVQSLCEGFNKGDARTLMRTLYPNEVLEALEDKGYIDLDDMSDDIRDAKKDLEEEVGSDVKMSYKVTDKKKLDDAALEACNDTLKYYSRGTGVDTEYTAKEGYKLSVNLICKGNAEKQTQKAVIYVVKLNTGEWVIDTSKSSGINKLL